MSQRSQKTESLAGFRWWGVMGKKAWRMDKQEPESHALDHEMDVAMDECQKYLWDVWAKARGREKFEKDRYPKTIRRCFVQIQDLWLQKFRDYPRFAVFAKRKDVQDVIEKIKTYDG